MKSRRLILTLLALFFLVLPLMAEGESFDFKSYILSYPKSVVHAPKYFVQEKPELIALFALGTGGLYFLDKQIANSVSCDESGRMNDVYTIVSGFGDAKYVFPALGATALSAYLLDADELLDMSLMSLKSAVLSSAATYTLKTVIRRGRPEEQRGEKFIGFGFDISKREKSFPSGHSTLAWSIAPVIAAHYPDQAWVKPLVYSLAGVVSFSRLAQDKHWASDVFAGALIGYSTAQLCLKDKPQLTFTILEDGSFIAGFSSSF
ncbi:MAG TPA: phosphatase PAP2 family protein [Candidatus Cloacimonetes bacterium]|nr:phosphatase PAP2 family protein [Candidatus Cloacimonadota bacterium]